MSQFYLKENLYIPFKWVLSLNKGNLASPTGNLLFSLYSGPWLLLRWEM